MLFDVPAHLVRQWCYCPRIVYYIELTDFAVDYPRWVRQGEKFHLKEAQRWKRRNLSRFNLENGQLHMDCAMRSMKHHLYGVADMVIESENEVYPVEFKLASTVHKRGALLQLATYGIIAQEQFGKKCRFGFLLEGEKVLHRIALTEEMTEDVFKQATNIRRMLDRGIKPDSSASASQCIICEYANHCNDRG